MNLFFLLIFEIFETPVVFLFYNIAMTFLKLYPQQPFIMYISTPLHV